MDISKLHRIYFLGIGGIGMSALARYFHNHNIEVSGYDKTATTLTSQLQEEGIAIHFDDNPELIPQNIDLVIYTPAIPSELKEFNYLRDADATIKKRSEILGELSKKYKTIAVAGTHGKTTVSTLCAHILHQSAVGCNAFLGGISKNYNSNLLESDQAEWMVTEADEFDRSFLRLNPWIGIVTSMDADHLDIYNDHQNLKNNFAIFTSQVRQRGMTIIKKGLDLRASDNVHQYNYSLHEEADFYASNIMLSGLYYTFDLHTPSSIIKSCRLGVPGMINVENAVVASAAAFLAGASPVEIRNALATFTGIKRRFDIRFNELGKIYIDDYAHHPEEINGLVKSIRNIFPGKKVVGIFQPHLFSRTRDFAESFSEALSLLDEVILLPIYPAREKPIPGVDASMLLDKITSRNKRLAQKSDLPAMLNHLSFDVLLTIGAGDIDQLTEPITNFLSTIKHPKAL